MSRLNRSQLMATRPQPRCRAAASRARLRNGPAVETLESRSLLSLLPFSAFINTGFHGDSNNNNSSWNIPIFVDGQLITSRGFAESDETMGSSPRLQLGAGTPIWIAGKVADSLLLASGQQANDVDLYRIELVGTGRMAVRVDAYGQRIGTGLDPALSIFDAAGNLIASDDDWNVLGQSPQDASLALGLDPGVYYVGVSGGGNLPGSGTFDPRVPLSGHSSRGTRGMYLLSLAAAPDSVAPWVQSTTLDSHPALSQPLSGFSVRFSEDVDLTRLASGVVLSNANGDQFAVAPISYAASTHEATFVALDRLPSDTYHLTLRNNAITDLAGNPLQAGPQNHALVIDFTVNAAPPSLVDTEANDTTATAQQLGVLFSDELNLGVQVSGAVHSGSAADADLYRFRVLVPWLYAFDLTGTGGGSFTAQLDLLDSQGNSLAGGAPLPGSGSVVYRLLQPGEYIVRVSGSPAADLPYQLTLRALAQKPEVQFEVETRPGPEIQLTFRSNADTTTSSASSPMVVVTTPEQLAQAIRMLPAADGAPAGRPRAERPDGSSLAHLDSVTPSAGIQRSILPPGFSLRGDHDGAGTQFSVQAVSGSAFDSFPESLLHENTAVETLTGLAMKAVGADATEDADRTEAVRALAGVPSSTEDQPHERPVEASLSPVAIAVGAIAYMGSTRARSGRADRKSQEWLYRALGWLGGKR